MRDQADELRLLVRQRIAGGSLVDGSSSEYPPTWDEPSEPHVHRARSASKDDPSQSQWNKNSDRRPDTPRKIVVSAGKGGVGTTTVAVNLAVSLARLGCRTVLVDADLSGADATAVRSRIC